MKDKTNIENELLIAEQLSNIMQSKSDTDDARLLDWIESNSYAVDTLELLVTEEYLTKKIAGFKQTDKAIQAEYLRHRIAKTKMKRILIRISSVAAAVTAISFLVYSINQTRSEKSPERLTQELVELSTPRVILPSGKNISVTEKNRTERVKDEKQVDLNVTSLNKLSQNTTDKKSSSEIMYRYIIPKTYSSKLELSDGTIVYLNADSELQFPTYFSDSLRKVTLRGEAYFEVKKDSKPFIVETEWSKIRVYGTKFNVRTYQSDVVEIVLVEGSVGVKMDGNRSEEVILKPNERCVSNIISHQHDINTVKPNKYLAWVDGYFRFEHDTLEFMLSELSRWYNVEFEIDKHGLKEILISGVFNQKMNLEEIIKTIELTIDVKFKKEGRRYTISNA